MTAPDKLTKTKTLASSKTSKTNIQAPTTDKSPQAKQQAQKPSMSSGGKNLIILGIASALIALATTSVSLALYHNSGDIYLDRSRPGYLPDKAEIEQTTEQAEDYIFAPTGPINEEVLTEYLGALAGEVEDIDANPEPFGPGPLSNQALGISD